MSTYGKSLRFHHRFFRIAIVRHAPTTAIAAIKNTVKKLLWLFPVSKK